MGRGAAEGRGWRAAAAAAGALLAAACSLGRGVAGEGTLRVVGSDTMLPLTRAWGEAFAAAHPGVRVRVEGGGSGAGVAALLGGRAQLCASSRPLTAAEAQRLWERHGRLGVAVQVAKEALEVFVHPSNPVRGLSLLQLKGIFTGRIRRWEKVGGAEGPIDVFIRPPGSGTHAFFRTAVLQGEEYAPFATAVATTDELLARVAALETAIGFGGMAHARAGVVPVAVEGVAPSPQAARDGTYPLARYLYLISVGPPEGAARRFVEFALSPAGQQRAQETGFIPLFGEWN